MTYVNHARALVGGLLVVLLALYAPSDVSGFAGKDLK